MEAGLLPTPSSWHKRCQRINPLEPSQWKSISAANALTRFFRLFFALQAISLAKRSNSSTKGAVGFGTNRGNWSQNSHTSEGMLGTERMGNSTVARSLLRTCQPEILMPPSLFPSAETRLGWSQASPDILMRGYTTRKQSVFVAMCRSVL